MRLYFKPSKQYALFPINMQTWSNITTLSMNNSYRSIYGLEF